jgi:hypothetical protein
MGFSLVGNSGSTSQSTTNYNYTADQNPQLSFGTGGGNLAVNFSPLAQGGSTGAIDPDIYYYEAPINITSTGEALGDSAVNALASTAQNAANAQTGSSASTSSLSSLLSGNTLYYILAAIIIFFIVEKK